MELPGGLKLAWDTEATIESFHPGGSFRSGNRAALAFACDDPPDVDATYDRMVEAGHQGELAPFDAPWGMRYAVLHDPDGIGVDLFAPLPTE